MKNGPYDKIKSKIVKGFMDQAIGVKYAKL